MIRPRCLVAVALLGLLLAGCRSAPVRKLPSLLRMVPIRDLEKELGLKASRDAATGMLRLSGDRGTVVFNPKFRGIVIGDQVRFRGHRVVISGDDVSVPPGFIEECEKLLRPQAPKGGSAAPTKPPPRFHVVIDPGHGGRDPGAPGANGGREKTVNLRVSRHVAEELRSKNIKATMTRTGDTFVALNDRPAVGNRLGADAFVSIHADAAPSRAATGFTVYVCHTKYSEPSRAALIAAECGLDFIGCQRRLAKNRAPSRALAARIRAELRGATRSPDRGTKLGALRVVRRSLCPAVLVELGYMSNVAESRRLRSPAYQKTLASAIARGIAAFLDAR